MRNLKRVLTLVMAVAMMMSLLVVGAGAAFPDQNKIVNTEAVNMNVALGIIKGRDTGVFDPTGNVTRAEMAKMICIVLNGGNEPTLGTKVTPSFTDIKGHWAEAYIEYCAGAGIVAGMGDGTFAPNANVTATQAAKMLLVSLGYDAAFEGFNGASWSVKINIAANQKVLYDELGIFDPNAPLNRDNAAQMVWNALNAVEVRYTYSLTTVNGQLQNVQVREDKVGNPTLLNSKFKAEDLEGQLVKFTYASKDKKWTYTISDGTDNHTFTSKTDFTGLFGQQVNVVYKSSTNVYGIYASESKVLFSGVVNDMTVNANSVKFDGKTYDLEAAATATDLFAFTYGKNITIAGEVAPTKLNALTATQKTYSFSAIDYDDNGDVDFFIVYPYSVAKVTWIGSKNITAGSTFVIEDTDVYTGIAKDDYTKITLAANTATNTDRLEKVDSMISGKVTGIKGSTYYIDNTAYTRAPSAPALSVGDKLKDTVIVNGYIFDTDATAAVTANDYAVVISATDTIGLNGPQARLLFTDGTKKVVDTDVEYTALIGDLVTFDINSDDEYELTAAINNQANNANKESGFKTVITAAIDTTTTKLKYIGTATIDDNAIVFVNEAGSYKVITGAALKTNASTAATNILSYSNQSGSTGFNSVQLAFVSSASLVSADSKFGYIVDDPMQVKDADGKVVYQLTIWDGTKNVTLLTKNTSGIQTEAALAVEGTVVEFSVNADDVIDVLSVTVLNGSTTSAIVAYDSKYVLVDGDSTRYEITKDTVILYINADKVVGSEGGAIQLATETGTPGTYFENAYFVANGSDELELLVVDINNDILDQQ